MKKSQEDQVQGNSRSFCVPLWVLLIVTVALFCLCMTLGRFRIPMGEFFQVILSRLIPITRTWSANVENVIWTIRFPRLCGALLVGSALAVSGCTYQGMFKNPLVSADLLGISSGACVGASIAIIQDGSTGMIQLCALAGGLSAVFIASQIPKLFRNRTSLTLVLSGIIVEGFFKSFQGLMVYIADPETQLGTITYWTMGSLAKMDMQDLYAFAPAMLLGMLVLLAMRWRINILSLGENEARALGMNITFIRGISVLAATTVTACAICMAGTIGWISLVIPHFGRLLVGPDNKKLLPASSLLGASFMMLIDTLARNLSNSEIPLSILTGFIGAPIYIWLLVKQRTDF